MLNQFFVRSASAISVSCTGPARSSSPKHSPHPKPSPKFPRLYPQQALLLLHPQAQMVPVYQRRQTRQGPRYRRAVPAASSSRSTRQQTRLASAHSSSSPALAPAPPLLPDTQKRPWRTCRPRHPTPPPATTRSATPPSRCSPASTPFPTPRPSLSRTRTDPFPVPLSALSLK